MDELVTETGNRVCDRWMTVVRLSPALCATVSFGVFVLCAPAGLFWLDSGELAAAGVNLGIAHATGFPGYCLLAKLASFVPVGELAFRINILSALTGALAVLWLGKLLVTLCLSETGPGAREKTVTPGQVPRLAAIAAATCAASFTLALSLTFLRQATVAEVYTPTAAAMMATLLVFARCVRHATIRRIVALGMLMGIGINLHISFVFVGVGIFVWWLPAVFRLHRWALILPVAFVLTALALTVYLPLRSASGLPAAHEWAPVDSLSGWWGHLRASDIRHAFVDRTLSTTFEIWSHDAGRFFADIGSQFLLGLLAAAAGLALLWRRQRWVALAVTCVVVFDIIYSIWMNPMGTSDRQNGILLACAVALAVGVTVANVGARLGRVGPYVAVVLTIIVVVPIGMVSLPGVSPASHGDLPRRWGQAALAQAGPRDIVMATNDSSAGPLLFLTEVEGARPDVAFLVQQKAILDSRACAQPPRAQPYACARRLAQTQQILERAGVSPTLVMREPGRVIWEVGEHWGLPGTQPVAAVPFARLRRRGAGTVVDGFADSYAALERLFDHPSASDPAARLLHASSLVALGRLARIRGQLAWAERFYSRAVALRTPDFVSGWVNRSELAAAQNHFELALAYVQRALDDQPNHATALRNAARYAYFGLRRADEGRGYIERALRVAPTDARVWRDAAVIAGQQGDRGLALRRVRRAISLAPGDQRLRHLEAQLGR